MTLNNLCPSPVKPKALLAVAKQFYVPLGGHCLFYFVSKQLFCPVTFLVNSPSIPGFLERHGRDGTSWDYSSRWIMHQQWGSLLMCVYFSVDWFFFLFFWFKMNFRPCHLQWSMAAQAWATSTMSSWWRSCPEYLRPSLWATAPTPTSVSTRWCVTPTRSRRRSTCQRSEQKAPFFI